MDPNQDLDRKEAQTIKKELKVQEKQNLEIRDTLAVDRTKLANERTLLAYLRTSLSLLIAGLTFLKVFEDDAFYLAVGIMFMGVGLGILSFGLYRFLKKKHQVSHYIRAYNPTSPVHAQVVEKEKRDPHA